MLIEPIVGLIHDVTHNRWHPVYFREYPLPGPEGHQAHRYKSGGHHTEGFETRELGLAGARDLAEKLKDHSVGLPRLSLEADFPWNGNDVPAIVAFFKLDGTTATPLF